MTIGRHAICGYTSPGSEAGALHRPHRRTRLVGAGHQRRPGDGYAIADSQRRELVDEQSGPDRDLHDSLARRAQHGGHGVDLVDFGEPARHRPAERALVAGLPGGGEPDRAGVERLPQQLVTGTVLEFAASVDELVVIEEKRPFIETQLRAILHEHRSGVPVLGKRDRSGQPLASSVGELDPRAVAGILSRVAPALTRRPAAVALFSERAGGPASGSPRPALPLIQLPGRPPGYCSGCPHNRSTVVPDGALAGGGVGCHGIMYFEARQAGTRSLPPPMGAEGVPWLGLSPTACAGDDRHAAIQQSQDHSQVRRQSGHRPGSRQL